MGESSNSVQDDVTTSSEDLSIMRGYINNAYSYTTWKYRSLSHTYHVDTRLRRTFGAKLTILPHPFNRKSALTTPFIRVPRSSFFLFRSTAALSSNRIYLPSGRRYSFFVRTMRARCTSPRLTLTIFDVGELLGMGRARLTTQTISSPTVPTPGVLFAFSTFTHSTRSAPELSIT